MTTTYEITSPDGRVFEVTAPKDATQDQVMSYAQGQFTQMSKPQDDSRFADNMSKGLDIGAKQIGQAYRQSNADALQNNLFASDMNFGGIADTSSPDHAQYQQALQKEILQTRNDPVLKTGGGKAGQFIAKAAPAALATFLPGGASLAGSTIIGLGTGAAEPILDGESRFGNMMAGGAGGAAGFGVGKGIGWAGGKFMDSASKAKATNALRDQAIADARSAGYVLPLSEINPRSFWANTLDILAGGRPKMAQAASIKNQQNAINRISADIGVPEGIPLTTEATQAIRNSAYRTGYEPLKDAGTIQPNQAYRKAVSDIPAETMAIARDFPELLRKDIVGLAETLNKPQFDSSAALPLLGSLRNQRNMAFRAGDTELGTAGKRGVKAVEQALEDHLAQTGQLGLLSNYNAARQLMAKTHSVDKAIDGSAINAAKLAKELKDGVPLTGELKTLARLAQESKKSVQVTPYQNPASSQLELWGAALAGAKNLALLGVPIARAGLRGAILSKPVQAMVGSPSYSGSMMFNALGSQPIRQALPAIGAMGLLGYAP